MKYTALSILFSFTSASFVDVSTDPEESVRQIVHAMAGGPDCENDKVETIEKKPVISETAKPKKSKVEKAVKKLEKAEKKKLIDEDTKAAIHEVNVEAKIKEAKVERKAAKKAEKKSPLEKIVNELKEE